MVIQAQSDMHGASRCPVCFKAPEMKMVVTPFRTLRDPSEMVELRCPLEHPPVALGFDLAGAVKLWNAFIENWQVEHGTLRTMPKSDSNLSACPNCKRFTLTEFRIVDNEQVEECAGCHLTKRMKDTY